MQNVTIKMKSKKLYWKGIEQLNSESTIVEGLENNELMNCHCALFSKMID